MPRVPSKQRPHALARHRVRASVRIAPRPERRRLSRNHNHSLSSTLSPFCGNGGGTQHTAHSALGEARERVGRRTEMSALHAECAPPERRSVGRRAGNGREGIQVSPSREARTEREAPEQSVTPHISSSGRRGVASPRRVASRESAVGKRGR